MLPFKDIIKVLDTDVRLDQEFNTGGTPGVTKPADTTTHSAGYVKRTSLSFPEGERLPFRICLVIPT